MFYANKTFHIISRVMQWAPNLGCWKMLLSRFFFPKIQNLGLRIPNWGQWPRFWVKTEILSISVRMGMGIGNHCQHRCKNVPRKVFTKRLQTLHKKRCRCSMAGSEERENLIQFQFNRAVVRPSIAGLAEQTTTEPSSSNCEKWIGDKVSFSKFLMEFSLNVWKNKTTTK